MRDVEDAMETKNQALCKTITHGVHFEVSAQVVHWTRHLFSKDVYIAKLASDTYRLILQLYARYGQWIKVNNEMN